MAKAGGEHQPIDWDWEFGQRGDRGVCELTRCIGTSDMEEDNIIPSEREDDNFTCNIGLWRRIYG